MVFCGCATTGERHVRGRLHTPRAESQTNTDKSGRGNLFFVKSWATRNKRESLYRHSVNIGYIEYHMYMYRVYVDIPLSTVPKNLHQWLWLKVQCYAIGYVPLPSIIQYRFLGAKIS